jgi:hypothetical protein
MLVAILIATGDPSRPDRNSCINWEVAERPNHRSNDSPLPRVR